jgi:hypothetical protein
VLDTLIVFAAMPFLFLVAVGFAPTIVIKRIGDKERFRRLSAIAFAAYCLFPAYAILDLSSKTLWQPPIIWSLVYLFELIIACFSIFLGLYLRQFANQAYNNAFREAIKRDFPPKKRTVTRTQNLPKK